jgi:deoxyadenosine/deoxycytidine kinase
MTNYRIALCGPSGSGKSTLANAIATHLQIPYKENSAGLLLPKEDQDFLISNFGWKKSGHSDVIALSHTNPAFGWEFQTRLLAARSKFMQSNANYIIDRSPVDNLVYFLMQTALHYPQESAKYFIEAAQLAARNLTHLIFIPTMLTGEIENNGSRVANYYYQQMVTSIFAHVIHTYFQGVKFLELPTSNFELRRSATLKFLHT